MTVLRRREQEIFLCLVDTVVAPAGDLPSARESDALTALDAHLRAAPRINRIGLRAMLRVTDVLPRLHGAPALLHHLDRPARTAALDRLRAGRTTAPVVKALQATAHMTYYGDDRVMRSLGYDADAVVARAAAVRQEHEC